ncbi:ABC transporter ATP-binding protein [Rhizobium sp. PAMB 3182]
MTKPLLQLDNISKCYGQFTAVNNLNLGIASGEFVAIMGPSGCGKTTTLRMMAGLEDPTRGEVQLQGRKISDLPTWQRETPLVWQNLALFPYMTVQDNVEFGLKMRKLPRRERSKRSGEWLERLGISAFADRNVAMLSGGQRQRVALARCLVLEPKILLLDEPLSALDAHMSIRMQGELKRLQRELGITFVYVTHSHSEAFSMADRIVIMNGGAIEQQGRPQDIFQRPQTRFVAQFIGGNSIFSGTPSTKSKGVATIDSADGILRLPGLSALMSDAPIELSVRADRIALSVQPRGVENEVCCTLMSEEFAGAVVNLYLESTAGTEIVAQLQRGDLDRLAAQLGQPIFASWAPEDGVVLGREKDGVRLQ